MRREVVRARSVVLAEVGGVIGSGAVARIHEVELGDPAACDVDGHEYGAGDSRMRDADGGTLVAAVVVVGDAGVVPRELVAVQVICRSIDVDVSAGVALREDVGVAARVVGASFEERVTRRLRAFRDSGVDRRLFTRDEHAVDVHRHVAGGAESEFAECGAVRAVGRGERLAFQHHVVVRCEEDRALRRTAEVVVGDVGVDVVRVDPERGEGDLDRAGEHRSAAAAVCDLIRTGERGRSRRGCRYGEPADDEAVSLDLVAVGKRHVDRRIAAVHREGIAVRKRECVVDRDRGGHERIQRVGHFHHLPCTVVPAHEVGEPARGAHEAERVVEDDLGIGDGARIDDERNDCRIGVAAVVCRGDGVVVISRACERERAALGEVVAPARDGDGDGSAVVGDDLDVRAGEAFGVEIFTERRVLEGIYRHSAVTRVDDLPYRTGGIRAVDHIRRRADFRIVRKSDDDVRFGGSAAARDGESGYVVALLGVIDEAVPVEDRLARRACRAAHHRAALRHCAVQLRGSGDLVSLHISFRDGGCAVGEGVGVRGERGHVAFAALVGLSLGAPCEVGLAAYGDRDGDGLCDRRHVVNRKIGYDLLVVFRRGGDHPCVTVLDGDVVHHAVDERLVCVILSPDAEAAHEHRDVDAEFFALTVHERVEQRGEIPADDGLSADLTCPGAGSRDVAAVHDLTEAFEVSVKFLFQFLRVGGADGSREVGPAVEVEVRPRAGLTLILIVALRTADVRRSDGYGDLMRLRRGEAPLIGDAHSHGRVACRAVVAAAVPAVVEQADIPREHTHRQLPVVVAVDARVDDVVVRAVDVVGHGRTAVGDEQSVVSGIDVVRAVTVGGILSVHAPDRISGIARRVVVLRAEHLTAAREAYPHQVGQIRPAGAVKFERERGAAARGVILHAAAEVLIARDIDGDLRHHEVERVAVHEARKSGRVIGRGREVDRGRVPSDGHGVRLRRLSDQVHTRLGGQLACQELSIQRSGGADRRGGSVCRDVAVVHRGVLRAYVGYLNGEILHIRISDRSSQVAVQAIRLEQLEQSLTGIACAAFS